MCGEDVIWSSTWKTVKTGDRPIPNLTASSNRRSGIVFTRVTPELITMASATASTPEAERRRAVSAAAPPPPVFDRPRDDAIRLEQLQVLCALPGRHGVLVPGQLVPTHP